MKLEIFNSKTLSAPARKHENSMIFSNKGYITFSTGISETLELEDNDTKYFLHLAKSEEDWFIMINRDPSGFLVRPKGGGMTIKNGFMINSKAIVAHFFKSNNILLDGNYRFDVAQVPTIHEGQKLLAIFLKSKKEMTKASSSR